MKHYDFPQKFRTLYDKAVGLYAKGQRGADTFFTAEEKSWLAANGITPQHMYDYAEDHNGYNGEPGFENALTIETIRRSYFLDVQKGKPSGNILDQAAMPAKAATAKGIEWVPRLIPKALAKLRGELPASLMYSCGGDRGFFKKYDILPAEFLSLVWQHEKNEEAIVDWVVARAAAK